MDGYAYVLERLREDDFRRLRAFAADGEATFGTWLVVVARRLVLDQRRTRVGRKRSGSTQATGERLETRRRLANLVSEATDVEESPDPTSGDPGLRLRLAERREALARALDALPPRDQLILSLRFLDGASGREIADLLGLPSPFHAYRRINGVLGRLRRRLEDLGIDDAEP